MTPEQKAVFDSIVGFVHRALLNYRRTDARLHCRSSADLWRRSLVLRTLS
jgi:hypothetical protein